MDFRPSVASGVCATLLLVSCAEQSPSRSSAPSSSMTASLVVSSYSNDDVVQTIDDGGAYLLRMLDDDLHGVHKYYYATRDEVEDRLHTIYTASTVYTLLKLYDYTGDDQWWEQSLDSGEYILSMQNTEGEKADGAFHYSYFIDRDTKEEKYPVGTTSKVIFTLLELHHRTGEEKYLDAATRGADWLLSMLLEDGGVKSYLRFTEQGKWMSSSKESTLYNGQVLSALSRVFSATGDERYREGADAQAQFLRAKLEKEGCHVGDDYRTPNPISESWIVMSFVDYYRSTGAEEYRDLLFECSEDLLDRLMDSTDDLADRGRWQRAYSSSGNGWIAEVLNEVYDLCRDEDLDSCDVYRDAIAESIRWLLQHVYTEEVASPLPNPERAHGGIFWSASRRHVRTDSVCHGLNALIGIVNDLPTGTILSVP